MSSNEYGFAGDISIYQPLGLPPNFWETCWNGNRGNISLLFVTIGVYKFTIPVRTMKALARTCKWFFSVVQWKLIECKQLYSKYSAIIARKLGPYLIYRSHPFNYTGIDSKIIPINDNIVADSYRGLCPLDPLHQRIFTDTEIANTRYSLVDIGFFTRSPVPFSMRLYLVGAPILSKSMSTDDYIDRGALSPSLMASYKQQYGEHVDAWPGRYYIKMRLPIMFNPITLGAPFVDMRSIYIYITPYSATSVYVLPDFGFILEHFTHVIMKFRTVDMSRYEWDNYGFVYNGIINRYIQTKCLVMHMSEIPNIDL